MISFHKDLIDKGIYGELSKITEELQEAYDAQTQGHKLMLLLELADIVGAVEGVLCKSYKDFSLEDLIKFQRLRSAVSVANGWASK